MLARGALIYLSLAHFELSIMPEKFSAGTTSDIYAVNDLLAILSGATNDTYVTKASRQNKARLVQDYIWDNPLLIHDKDEILTIFRSGEKLNRRLDKEFFKISIEQWAYMVTHVYSKK